MATVVHDYWSESPSPRLVPDEDWEPSIRSGSANDNEANFVVRDCAKIEYVSSSVRTEDNPVRSRWSATRESKDGRWGGGVSSSRGNQSRGVDRAWQGANADDCDDRAAYGAYNRNPHEDARTRDHGYAHRNINVMLSSSSTATSNSSRDEGSRSYGYGSSNAQLYHPLDTHNAIRVQQPSRSSHAGVTPLVALAYAPSPSYERSELDRSPEDEFSARSTRSAPVLVVQHPHGYMQDQQNRRHQSEYVRHTRSHSNAGDRSGQFIPTPLREAIDPKVPPIMHWDVLPGGPAAHRSYAVVAPTTHSGYPPSHVLIPTYSFPQQYAHFERSSQRLCSSQDATDNARAQANSSPSPQPRYEESNRAHTTIARQSGSRPAEKERRKRSEDSERTGREGGSENSHPRQGVERLGLRAVPSAPPQRPIPADDGRDALKVPPLRPDPAAAATQSSSRERKESTHRRHSRSSRGSSRLSTTRTPETSRHAAHGRRSASRATSSSSTLPSSFVSSLELAAAENEVENVKEELQKKHAELAQQQQSFSERVHEKVAAHDAENEDARHHQRREFQRSLEVLREENDELRATVQRLEDAASPATRQEQITHLEKEWKQKVSQLEKQWERRLLDAHAECKEQVEQAMSARNSAEKRSKELVISVQELERALQSMVDEKESLSRSIAEQSLQRAREMDSLIVTPRDSQYATNGAPPLSVRSTRSASVAGGGAAPPQTASSSSSVAVIALEREVQQLRQALRDATAFQDTLVTQIEIGGREVAMIDKNTDATVANLKRELQRERRRSADLVKLYGSQIETLHRQLAEMTKKNQMLAEEVRRLEKIQSEMLI